MLAGVVSTGVRLFAVRVIAVCTFYMERQNLTMRMQLRRLTGNFVFNQSEHTATLRIESIPVNGSVSRYWRGCAVSTVGFELGPARRYVLGKKTRMMPVTGSEFVNQSELQCDA
jgi:hypothetical protein